MKTKQISYFIFALVGVILSAGSSQAASLRGTWGGHGIRLEVTLEDAPIPGQLRGGYFGRIALNCAAGTIGTFIPAGNDFFGVGTYTQGSGVVQINQHAQPQPAKYIGFVNGDEMVLILILESDPKHSTTYTLKHGSQGQLQFCG